MQAYHSDYSAPFLAMTCADLRARAKAHCLCCGMFDNTTFGAAAGNALVLQRMLLP